MPNWVYNDVTVSGDKNEIAKFFKECFVDESIDYDKIIPQPKTKRDCPADYICDPAEAHIEPCKGREWFNWYTWNYDNWGTKWNACDGTREENSFFFSSPWDHPTPIFLKLMKLYPKLTFEVDVYGETDFPCIITYKNGVRTVTETERDEEDW